MILGGGFGGAYCAQALERRVRERDLEILLIDRNNYFVFYPLLIEAGTGSLEPRHAVVSLRAFLRRATFRMAEVRGIDAERRTVCYRRRHQDGDEHVSYDYLVVALGGVTSLPDVPGLREFGFSVKALADAVALRDRAIEMLELADATEDAAERRARLHFVVVGGNFTGVEVAGELSTFLRQAARGYERIAADDIQVTLVELTERILRALGPDLSDYAATALRCCGVDVRLGESVTRIERTRVHLACGGVRPAHTVIWCAGIAPNPLIARLPFPTDPRGYIVTERDLRVPGFPAVWAIGDCAANPGPDGAPYPATAQHAVRQAAHAARDIARVRRGLPTRPCNIASQGSLAAIGCRTGVARVFGVKISGFWAWWLYRSVYLLKMPGLARKTRIALDWTIALLFPREHVQLSVHARPPAPAPERTGPADERARSLKPTAR